MVLSGRLSVQQVVGKIKSLAAPIMRGEKMEWQDNFFEHRLRPEDKTNEYARYIFLNPYRAGLLERKEKWPWWRRAVDCEFEFLSMLDESSFPPVQWLTMDDETLGVVPSMVGSD